jgi:uncharacterized spore protein YtfJ
MSLNKLFDTIEEAKATANWQAAFGEPKEVEGRTIIPVARVSYGFGLGFGQSTGPSEEEDEPAPESEGGGGGGGAWAKPLGAIVVTPEEVYFEETLDVGKISLAGFLLGGFFILQMAKTLRAIFGRA